MSPAWSRIVVVIDVFYPIDAITQVAKEFRQNYRAWRSASMSRRSGEHQARARRPCSIGVIGSLPVIPIRWPMSGASIAFSWLPP